MDTCTYIHCIYVYTCMYTVVNKKKLIIIIGIDVDTPQGHMRAHAVLLISCVDLPAQAKLLNMKQYNGKFGCHACEDEGAPRPGTHLQRNWPFNLSCNLRTHSSVKCSAREAVRDRKPVSQFIFMCLSVLFSLHLKASREFSSIFRLYMYDLPQRIREGYCSYSVSVCMCVCYHASCYIPRLHVYV